jgi:GntR family transcriptional repressor for pyruvate dehydrogenase complex
MASSPIPRVSVPDHVFARLSEAILSGAYAPGERLPAQRALAADLQVNMASVREALGRLEQLRLIDVRHGDGARVLDWRRTGGLETLLHVSAQPSLIGDLFEARCLLLVEAARLAATRRTQAQADELLRMAEGVALASDDHGALLADWTFMEALVESAHNLVFRLIMNSVRELYLPHADGFAALVEQRARWAPLYASTARAVRDGDGDRAAAAIGELAGAQAVGMRG